MKTFKKSLISLLIFFSFVSICFALNVKKIDKVYASTSASDSASISSYNQLISSYEDCSYSYNN